MQTPGGNGLVTTEFFTVMATFAAVILNGTEYVNIETSQINMLMGLTAAYVGQRGYVKGKAKVGGYA